MADEWHGHETVFETAKLTVLTSDTNPPMLRATAGGVMDVVAVIENTVPKGFLFLP